MNLDGDSAVTASPADANCAYERALALLRQQGADQWNSVDFHYMEAMARRLIDQVPKVRKILEGKLQLALAAYQAHFEIAQRKLALVARQNPSSYQAGSTLLSQLAGSMTHTTTALEPSSWSTPSGSRTELKSVRHFRNTWSQLSAQKHVAQALDQAPKNAGPINSHMLVLRSLELMRDISPEYLNCFMSYADTLLCLEQTDLSARGPQAKPLASATPKPKPKPKPKARTPART